MKFKLAIAFSLLIFSCVGLAKRVVVVEVDNLPIRTCPNEKCGIIGYLNKGEKLDYFYELKGPWVRISESFPAKCSNGKSDLVIKGNNSCLVKNGIENEGVSKWVSTQNLKG